MQDMYRRRFVGKLQNMVGEAICRMGSLHSSLCIHFLAHSQAEKRKASAEPEAYTGVAVMKFV